MNLAGGRLLLFRGCKLYSDRESNSDLLFRRELFYPLNYQSNTAAPCHCGTIRPHNRHDTAAKTDAIGSAGCYYTAA